MDPRQRDLYAKHVLELRGLSELSSPGAAIIVGTESGIIAEAYSKPCFDGSQVATSPITEVVCEYLKRKGFMEWPHDCFVLFCTNFPQYHEILLLLHTEIRTIRYFGDIEDERSVRFLNEHTNKNPDGGFEIINLQK